jgi:hypothetical protein
METSKSWVKKHEISHMASFICQHSAAYRSGNWDDRRHLAEVSEGNGYEDDVFEEDEDQNNRGVYDTKRQNGETKWGGRSGDHSHK